VEGPQERTLCVGEVADARQDRGSLDAITGWRRHRSSAERDRSGHTTSRATTCKSSSGNNRSLHNPTTTKFLQRIQRRRQAARRVWMALKRVSPSPIPDSSFAHPQLLSQFDHRTRQALDVGPLLGGGGVGVQANFHQGLWCKATIKSFRSCRDSSSRRLLMST